MRPKNLIILLSFALLPVAGAAGASTSAAFDEIMQPYEEVRLLLVADSTDGVADYAALVRDAAQAATDGAAESADVQKLLPQIAKLAGGLAAAVEIEAARDAFYELSKLLVQVRAKISGDDLPVVMYCPMVKRSWLQPDGDTVGNPYYGRKMSDCGNVVGK